MCEFLLDEWRVESGEFRQDKRRQDDTTGVNTTADKSSKRERRLNFTSKPKRVEKRVGNYLQNYKRGFVVVSSENG